MIRPVVDTHTHTIASVHAYSTIIENAASARKKGLRGMAITDHAPGAIYSAPMPYFQNQVTLPREIDGVRIFTGVEANIIDFEGTIDMAESVLKNLEVVIASCHNVALTPGTVEEHTRAYEGVARNPFVDIIGHCGQDIFQFDYERGLRAFKEYGKIVEINAHSFYSRPGSVNNCVIIAELCKKMRIPVVVSSDAHFAGEIGEFGNAVALLEAIDFPEDLILNLELERFMAALSRRR